MIGLRETGTGGLAKKKPVGFHLRKKNKNFCEKLPDNLLIGIKIPPDFRFSFYLQKINNYFSLKDGYK